MVTNNIASIDFEGAKQLVHQQLSQGLDKNLFYHGAHHTFDDVLPNSILLINEMKDLLTDEQALIVKTAALFHDTGFLDQYDKNEPRGCDRARQYLPPFGYTQSQIDEICVCIMATQMPQNPGENLLAQMVCDADLGHLGTDLYFLRAEALRMELTRLKGLKLSPLEWNKSNVPFMEKHRYFTVGAGNLFQKTKEQNMRQLLELLQGVAHKENDSVSM